MLRLALNVIGCITLCILYKNIKAQIVSHFSSFLVNTFQRVDHLHEYPFYFSIEETEKAKGFRTISMPK